MTAVRRIKPLDTFVIDQPEWEAFPNNYRSMYDKLMDEIGEDDRIDYIYFGYCPEVKGNTIQIFTKRCTLFYPDVIFAEDHSNDREVLYKVLYEWSKLPRVEEKEQYTGRFKGRTISFTRIWSGHRFNDVECQQLLAGEIITITATNREGKQYEVSGQLEQQEYQNFKFYGFKPNFDKHVPEYFNGHRILESEKRELEGGKELYFKDLVSKKTGKTYSAFITFTKQDGLKMRFPERKSSLSYDARAVQEVETGAYNRNTGWKDYESDFEWSGSKW